MARCESLRFLHERESLVEQRLLLCRITCSGALGEDDVGRTLINERLRGAKVSQATPEERARVRTAVAPFQDRITGWLNSFASNLMPDEAAAFMYLQLAIEEMPPG